MDARISRKMRSSRMNVNFTPVFTYEESEEDVS